MSQIEGNNSVLPDMRSGMQEESRPNIRTSINYDQEQADIKDVFENLPEDIKEFVKTEVSSLDDMIKALQYLLHSSVSTSLSQGDFEGIQLLIKQLSSLPQFKDQQNVKSSALLIGDEKLEANNKAGEAATKLLPSSDEQSFLKLGKAELLSTDTEEAVLLKNMGSAVEQMNIHNKLGAPLIANDNNKALLESYRRDIAAMQLLADAGTKVTVNGHTVSVYGSQGVLSTENIVTFMARGDQAFLDNARVAAVNEGYNTFGTQQEGDGQNNHQENGDNKQEPDSDTLFFYEDE
jgi:hypothetical protein